MDVFNSSGQKIGYTNKTGAFVPVNGGGGGYQNQGNNGYQVQGNNGYQRKKKHTGAKVIEKDGISYVSAFNYSKSKGLVTVFCAPYKGTGVIHKSEKGNSYITLMAKISYKNSGVEKHFPVLMNLNTNKIVLDEMGWIINPKAPDGGYCGTFKRS